MQNQRYNFIHNEFNLFLSAMIFFTRIPCGSWLGNFKINLNKASRYFPLVGIIVGGIGAMVYLLSQTLFSNQIAILLSMIATIWITGAFHEDGFADCCDGFGGGWTKSQILTIMKDSCIGTYGAIGMGLMLTLKFFALSEIQHELLPITMIAGHSLSRFAAVTFIHTHLYVREDESSKSKSVTEQMSVSELLLAGSIAILPLFFLNHYHVLLAIIPVFLSRWLMGRYFVRRIGGYTGDCLGAVQQVTEVIFYLFI